jgi:putative RecB family exonuclease
MGIPAPRPSRPPRPPDSLSPSRAADFMRCPLLYRLRVIDRVPEKPSPAATRGTVVHAVLERLFDVPAAERTADRARALVPVEWERLLAARPELAGLFEAAEGAARAEPLNEWLAGAERLVERWFTLEDPTRLEPAEREMYVETVLESGLTLRGYVDRLDVAPATGDLRVVDYKTGKAPRPQYADEPLFQMKFYALVLWRLRGLVPRRLQLVYLGSGDVLTYDPTEADLRLTERRLLALWQAIRQATETGDWRPRRTPLCGWCDHQVLCPEFGGTPPPYPLPLGTAPEAPPGAPPEARRETTPGAPPEAPPGPPAGAPPLVRPEPAVGDNGAVS